MSSDETANPPQIHDGTSEIKDSSGTIGFAYGKEGDGKEYWCIVGTRRLTESGTQSTRHFHHLDPSKTFVDFDAFVSWCEHATQRAKLCSHPDAGANLVLRYYRIEDLTIFNRTVSCGT